MNLKTLNVLGVVGTVLSIGATLLGGWVGNKKQERLLEDLVSKAVDKKLGN